MEYEHYVDLDMVSDHISEASRILDRVKPRKDDEKTAKDQAQRHLTEAWFWIANLRGDI